MATVKISALPNASSVSQSDELPVNVSSTTSRVTVGELLSAINATDIAGLRLAQQGSAPTATTDVVKVYAVAVGGRAEPSLFLEDSVVVPVTRTPRRSTSTSTSFEARDEIVWVTANAINLTLPSPTNHDGRQYLVIKSHAGANAITLVRTGSESINGTAASFVLTASGDAAIGEWHITTDGTNWIVSGGAL